MPGVGWLALAGTVLAAVLILYEDRHLSFHGDDWTFVIESVVPPRWGLLAPHNEHWVTLHRALYQALFQTAGIRSYLPFLAVLLLAHVGVGLALFVLVRRRAGDVVALFSTALFALFGAGAENLAWAFQIEMVAPVLCGLVAMALLERPLLGWGGVAASLALVAGVMMSSIGIVYAVAVAVELALDRARRRRLLVLGPAAMAYLAWFLLIGRTAVGSERSPLSLDAVGSLVGYVPTGVAASLAGLIGVRASWGFVLLVAALPALILRWWKIGPPSSRAVGAICGVLALFVLAGLVRGQYGIDQAASSRYLYVAAPLVLLLVADSIAGLRLRLGWWAALTAAAALSIALNVVHLRSFIAQRTAMISHQNVQLEVVGAVRSAPDLDRDVEVNPPFWTPITPRQYYAAVDRYGSPVPQVEAADLSNLPAQPVDDTLRLLFGHAIRSATAGVPSKLSGCVLVAAGTAVPVEVSSAGSLVVVPVRPGALHVYLWAMAGRPSTPTTDLQVAGPVRVAFPDTGSSLRWKAAVVSPSGTEVCPASP